jgi:phenylalanyl-tRNA synthetase beta chain
LRISLNWIKDYINLDGISVEQIVDRLTMSGLEVEEVVNQNEIYKDFVVGFVKEKKKHPNADKLSVCIVNDGKTDHQVICGAPNVDTNQKVVFAPIGTIIPKGAMKIGKAKIRGVESYGMLCSEAELELSENHEGIMVLENSIKPGSKITEALGLNDVILEIAITPNRSDALSHIGIARDLSAIFSLELKYPSVEISEAEEKVEKAAHIEIKAPEDCPRYSAKIVKNVQIKQSPNWLTVRLKNIGLRPINNIVDVTNYVMYELGQPLHAFDLDSLKGKKIIVKNTEREIKFKTLDSKERKLLPNTLMICDAEKEIAIAGIMGGENSEVNSQTKNILIESANFNPSSIRKSSKSLGLSTDASYRFERGTDPNKTDFASKRAAKLISELSGGEVLNGIIDVYPNKAAHKEVRLRFAKVNKILGYEIPKEDILQILKNLEIKTILESGEEYRVSVPTFRPDIEREIDLIEEIARIYGYEKIPVQEKVSISLGVKHDESEFGDNIRDYSVALGLSEMINNPLQSEKLAHIIGKAIRILNPQSLDMEYLRTSLIPGALQVVSNNLRVGEKDLAFFELGHVFEKKNERIEDFIDFMEKTKAIFILTGYYNVKEWNKDENKYNFYSLKGLVDEFLNKFFLDNVLIDSYYNIGNKIFTYIFAKSYKEQQIGNGGKINEELLKQFDIEQDVYCFEFDIDALQNIPKKNKKYNALLKFPKVFKDFAFVFDKSITYEEVIKYIKNNSSDILKSIKIFDLFESANLGESKKSMAFSLEYFSNERTLTEEEVEKDFNRLINLVTKKFDALLRGS